MDSYQVEEWGRPLQLKREPTPVPSGTEVLIRVSACGVCHSDVHIREGRYDMGERAPVRLETIGIRLPLTMGHEIVGVVEAAGPDADIPIGSAGVVYPWIGCGQCNDCLRGNELDCATPRSLGTRRPGGYSSHVLVPHPRYVVDYRGIDPWVAATAACSGLTAYSAVRKVPSCCADDFVVVVGAGGLGLAALEFLKIMSPARIVVVDSDPGKLALARNHANAIYSSADADTAAVVKQLSGGGVRAVLDFVGMQSTFEWGLSVLAKGGTMIEVGLFGGSTILPIPLLPMRNLKIMGSYVGTLEDLHQLLVLIRERGLGRIPLFGRPITDLNRVLDELATGQVAGRVIVQP
jgi:D-arabinose 1-dehydrogenase-like Zn-dependent alcohol dehydrogenase